MTQHGTSRPSTASSWILPALLTAAAFCGVLAGQRPGTLDRFPIVRTSPAPLPDPATLTLLGGGILLVSRHPESGTRI